MSRAGKISLLLFLLGFAVSTWLLVGELSKISPLDYKTPDAGIEPPQMQSLIPAVQPEPDLDPPPRETATDEAPPAESAPAASRHPDPETGVPTPSCACRLISRTDRTPIAGVEVKVKDRKFRTDAEGGLALEPKPGTVLVVDIPGYVRARFIVPKKARPEPDTPPEPLLLPLPPACTLTGIALDYLGQPHRKTRVRVRSWPLSTHEAPGSAVLKLPIVWKTETDDTGRFAIKGLPAGIPLDVKLRFKAAPAFRLKERPILQPRETRDLRLVSGPCGTVRGQILDAGGSPISNARVKMTWIKALHGRGERKTSRHAWSDHGGSFEVKGLACGRWLMKIRPVKKSKDRTLGAQDLKYEIVIPSHGTVISRTVVVSSTRWIRGRVVRPDGRPAEGIHVNAACSDLNARTGTGGFFVLGPVYPGRYELRALAYDKGIFGDSPPVMADAGGPDVLLTLTLAGLIEGTSLDAATGKPLSSCITAWKRSGTTGVKPRESIFDFERDWSFSGDDGTFSFEGLEPGVYALTAETEDGRFGLVRNVRVRKGESIRNLKIPLHKGGHILVQKPKDDPFLGITTLHQDGQILGCEFWSTGGTTLLTSPPGEVCIQINMRTKKMGKKVLKRRVFVPPGGKITVRF